MKANLLRIEPSIFRNLHKVTINAIVATLSRIVIDEKGKDAWENLDTILLVGGYSDCPLLREAIQKEFLRLKVVAPERGGNAVLT
ncbi:hypothetical protein DPMN_148124 [Dreissena polymorpha]|uniref:Uncharacterized protein n=1 Tax=Dreissena polymorpha TaxID=45954 RepID=A0A9D4J413_DREPO|nr:hypothetical protein DPMN_148124 [Dreissena polymorpha]